MIRPGHPRDSGVTPQQPHRGSDIGFLRATVIGLSGLWLCLCLTLAALSAVGGTLAHLVSAAAPIEPNASVVYVLDASARMQNPAEGSNGNSRLWVAQSVLCEVVHTAEPSLGMSLTTF